MKKKNKAVFLTRGASIAAIYVILTYLSHLLGLASGVIQLRLSEMLCVLPAFLPEAVAGLWVGCILSNLLTSCAVFDIIFGSLATLIGALCSYLIAAAARRLSGKLEWLIPLPTVAANVLILPPILKYAFGIDEAIPFLMLTIGIGEMISAFVFGLVLYYTLKKRFYRF